MSGKTIYVDYVFVQPWSTTRGSTNAPYSRLTPLAAREILYEVSGQRFFMRPGAVFWPEGGYGYRVYAHSTRKIYKRWEVRDV